MMRAIECSVSIVRTAVPVAAAAPVDRDRHSATTATSLEDWIVNVSSFRIISPAVVTLQPALLFF
jgi:hypothetical protein